jgi:O-antigen ligase
MVPNTKISYQAVLVRMVILTLAALVLTPLVFDPLALDDGFMTPKWAWICGWSILGSGISLALLLSGYTLRARLDLFGFSIIALVLFHWFSVAWSSSPDLAVERAKRITWIFMSCWLGVQFLRRESWLRRLAGLFIGMAVFTSLWIMVEDCVRAWMPERTWIRPNLPDWRGYLAAGLGNTNHIGDFLALAMIPSLIIHGFCTTRKLLLLNGMALVIIPAGLVICYSVGSILGLMLAILILAILILMKEGFSWFLKNRARWLWIIAVWVGVILFFTTDHPLNLHRPGILRQGFASERWKDGFDTRLAIWAQGLEMVRHHRFMGVGAGNFSYLFPAQDSPLLSSHPHLRLWQGLWTNAAHNALLQMWAELGIFGLFLFVVMLILAYHSLLTGIFETDGRNFYTRVILTGLLTGWIGHSMMNFCFQHPTGALCLFGIFMAVMIEKITRPRTHDLPSLRWETPPLAIHVDWKEMNRPSELGMSLILPPLIAKITGLTVILLFGAIALNEYRPVHSQHLYKRARLMEGIDINSADKLYQRALAVYGSASDCRSRYSEWLIQHNRHEEALEQLKIVRERLGANEIWLREYRAYRSLGREDESRAVYSEFLERFWIPVEPGTIRDIRHSQVDRWMGNPNAASSRP